MISFFIMSNEQTHPLHATDKKIIDSLISKDIPEDFDLINLARLINRYDNFPGEIEIKDFGKIVQNKVPRGWRKNAVTFVPQRPLFGLHFLWLTTLNSVNGLKVSHLRIFSKYLKN